MKRYFLAIVILFLVAFVLYNSVYFEKLDLKKQRELKKNFNPKEAVDFLLNNKLDDILKTTIDLKSFDSLLVANPKYLVQQYGKSVGISSNYSFLISGITKTVMKNKETIPVDLPKGNVKYNLVAKYIFGNAARDAVGYFKLDDFENTMDFNAVSTELNSVILREVIGNKLNSLSAATTIKFVGAVEINSESIDKQLDIVPLKIEVIR